MRHSWGMNHEPTSRAEAARRRVELSEANARNEAIAAQKLIDAFIERARATGLEPVPLRAQLFNGKQVKTDKQGWYIRRNHSIAVGVDGGYYILTIAGGLAERLRGAKLSPTLPPLVVGRGGRDGETGDLSDFLDRALRGLE